MTDKSHVKEGGRCLIILPYIEGIEALQPAGLAEDADFVVCADGGQTVAKEYGITPNTVIGDFDSTDTDFRFDCPYIAYPSEKDITDCEACFLFAADRHFGKITVLGGMGGRIDHTMGAIGALCAFFEKFPGGITFVDGRNTMTAVKDGTIVLERSDRYKYFSLFSLDEKAAGVSIKGAKYELDDVVLPRASTLGISNEIAEDSAEITIRKGTVLVMRSSDPSAS